MTTQHYRQDTPGLDFRLPPNITVTRHPFLNGIAYVFRDVELGELGRLAVEGTPTGETSIVSEVAGDPADPMTARRLAMLDPLCQDLTHILESIRGRGRAGPLWDPHASCIPTRPSPGREPSLAVILGSSTAGAYARPSCVSFQAFELTFPA